MTANSGLNQQKFENYSSCKLNKLSMNKKIKIDNTFFEIRCQNVHFLSLEKGPCVEEGDKISEIFGVGKEIEYEYCHYCCDRFDDRGWGCGYRTLQTIASWIINRKELQSSEHQNNETEAKSVPSISEIQKILVEDLKDKPNSFNGSRDWIGSFEVCLILDYLYDVPSKIIHAPSIQTKGEVQHGLLNHVEALRSHFQKFGSPIMMGGDVDCSSKGIFGIATTKNKKNYLLVVDPHFWNKSSSSNSTKTFCEQLQNEGWIQWKCLETDFCDSSFYNLCLPQLKSS